MSKKAKKADRKKSRMQYGDVQDQIDRQSGKSTLILPSNTQLWKPKAGKHLIEILPYMVETEHNPNCKKGKGWYERTYQVHNNVGPSNEAYICLTSFGKSCPICDYRLKAQRDPDAEENMLEAMKPKLRQLFNVFVHEEAQKGIQVWDMSYWLFGSELVEKIRDQDEGDGYEKFFYTDKNGMTLRVVLKEKSGGKFSFLTCSDIQFKKRKKALKDELLEGVCTLDELLKEEKSTSLKKALQGLIDAANDDDEDEDEDKKSKKKKSKVKSKKKEKDEDEDEDEDDFDDDGGEDDDDDDNDDDDVEEDEEEDDDDDDDDDDEDDDDDDDEDDDEEDEDDDEPKSKKSKAKSKSKSKKSKKKSKDDDDEEDEDEDEEDEDEDDEPVKKKGKKTKAKGKGKKEKKGKKKDEDEDDDDDDWS